MCFTLEMRYIILLKNGFGSQGPPHAQVLQSSRDNWAFVLSLSGRNSSGSSSRCRAGRSLVPFICNRQYVVSEEILSVHLQCVRRQKSSKSDGCFSGSRQKGRLAVNRLASHSNGFLSTCPGLWPFRLAFPAAEASGSG